jgi:hypothetical protein
MTTSNTPAPLNIRTSSGERDWFGDTVKLFDSLPGGDAEQALAEAAGIWLGYAMFAEAIECLPDATSEEKRKLRGDLDCAHYKASHVLMLEAERTGLNAAPLAEARRVCQELFRPIRSDTPHGRAVAVEWFHHPDSTSDHWPDCLGPRRYLLPPAVQEIIRAGEEVFVRLVARIALVPPSLARSEGGKPKGVPLAEAELRVRGWLLRYAKTDPASVTRDAVAEGTGVSSGQVSRTTAWQAFRERRDAERSPVTRAIPLTDGMLSVIPDEAKIPAELASLIEEQGAELIAESRRHGRRHGSS